MNAAAREEIFLPFLRRLPLFEKLTDSQIRHLALGSRLLEFSKGDIVCDRKSAPEGFFCVVEGRIKLAMLSEKGAERVVEILQPGRTFGESGMFLGQPCPVFAQALSKSRLMIINKEHVLSALRRWPEISLALLAGMSARMHGLLNDLGSCCLQTGVQRIAQYLISMAQSGQGNLGRCEVVLPAGKAVVASSLNLTPETFSRELHHLADRKVISVEKRTIVIHDMDRLQCVCAG